MFLINLQGKESIYEQIKTQILRFIQTGVLSPNDKLPSVRQLAEELGINPNTVQKAYQELERDGYIYTLSKKGNYVAEQKKASEKDDLKSEFNHFVGHFISIGLDKETMKEWIDNYKEDTYDIED